MVFFNRGHNCTMTRNPFESMDSTTFNGKSNKRKYALGHERNAGAPCLNCDPVKCEGGLDLHFWRKICKTCKCKAEEHDIKRTEEEAYEHVVHKLFSKDSPVSHIHDYFRKLGDANNTQRSQYAKQFAWCPTGLEDRLLMKYMEALPPQVEPKIGSDGAKYRRKQIMYQLPIHDHDENYCDNLTEPEKASMRQFCDDRNQNALGVGYVREKNNPVSKWVCYRCNGDISLGEVAVFASRAGENKCWHPGCFACIVCNNILVDLIYFYKDGGIYCGRHYAELFKPRCSACDELIYAEEHALEASGKNWHQNHLCCDHCDEPLSKESLKTVDGKPSCSHCYDKNNANMCDYCGKVIAPGTKDHVDVKGKHWHEKCFVGSQLELDKRLPDQELFFNNDKTTCRPSCESSVLEVCEACGEEFSPGEEKILYQCKSFHHNCFTCNECTKPLGTQEFVKRDGKHFCKECADALDAKICDRCNEAIKSSWAEYDGKTYHTDCFSCALCFQSIAGKAFKKHEGNNICHDCYRVNFGKSCNACQKPVEEGVEFVPYEGEFFHLDCFTCANCGLALELKEFYVIGNEKMCVSCFH
ncbi:testin-like [Montipora foliosa]|uniref:testin-like n=1 Tax=Montipora foliosa TaxID=591990 RepID=UPI0035F13B9D